MNRCPDLLAVCTEDIFHNEENLSPPNLAICVFHSLDTFNLEIEQSNKKGISDISPVFSSTFNSV